MLKDLTDLITQNHPGCVIPNVEAKGWVSVYYQTVGFHQRIANDYDGMRWGYHHQILC